MKNKFVAAGLAFIGGSIGLHKFYLGDSGAGIFYIFLTMMTSSVFPVSVILSFIDGLRYLMMPPEEFDRKFNKRRKRTRQPRRKAPSQREQFEARRKKSKRGTIVRSNPFKKSGLKKYKEYDIEEAIEDFMKALKIDPQDVSIYFNLACAYSLLENKEKAFQYLEQAVERGMKDKERILKHDDLAFIRIQPEFHDFKMNDFKMARQRTRRPAEKGEAKPMDDILLAQLNRLMELRKKGVLTEQEFLRERKKVLAR